MMKIVEKFRSVQGEGPHSGKPVTFIRLAGCNLRCKWCDSEYAWKNIEKIEDLSIQRIREEVKTEIIIWTGGEPCISPYLKKYIKELKEYEHHIETNGTIANKDLYKLVSFWSISPKTKESQSKGVAPEPLLLWDIKKLKDYCVKIVYENNLDYVRGVEEKYNIPTNKIWLMPEGVVKEKIEKGLKELWDMELDYNISPRLHIQLYNNKRGV